KHGEGVVVGPQVHVRLLDAGEALDGGAVEHDVAVQGLFQLPDGNLYVLEDSQNVGELQADELDAVLFCQLEDVLLAQGCHVSALLMWRVRPARADGGLRCVGRGGTQVRPARGGGGWCRRARAGFEPTGGTCRQPAGSWGPPNFTVHDISGPVPGARGKRGSIRDTIAGNVAARGMSF